MVGQAERERNNRHHRVGLAAGREDRRTPHVEVVHAKHPAVRIDDAVVLLKCHTDWADVVPAEGDLLLDVGNGIVCEECQRTDLGLLKLRLDDLVSCNDAANIDLLVGRATRRRRSPCSSFSAVKVSWLSDEGRARPDSGVRSGSLSH